MPDPIIINGYSWTEAEGVNYLHDYREAYRRVKAGEMHPLGTWRSLCLEDLWFVVYFVMGVGIANCEWWVERCLELQRGPRTDTLDIWPRDHGKSTIITIAETIQDILRDREERIGLFSFTRAASRKFFGSIKMVLESSVLLRHCFPDVIWEDPFKEAPQWSENGLVVKRDGYYKEATLEPWGLLEGMPTGSHFTKRVYDDIMVWDLMSTPENIAKVKEAFDMSQKLGTAHGRKRVTGTPYHHEDCLMYIAGLMDIDQKPIYTLRKYTATIDGTPNGPSAYLPERRLAEERVNKQQFYSQYLCDPTPQGTQKLDPVLLKEVTPKDIPPRLFKFMAIDPAGQRKDNRQGDSWGIAVVGVEPMMDDLGASAVYILDLCIEPMTEPQAMERIVSMFVKGGRILRLGVEKVGISTAEIHIAAALRARGRSISIENGGLQVLSPRGRAKELRIEQNLSWPLLNGKIAISTAVPRGTIERLKTEMQKFPYWHDDGLDSLSYVYDLVKDYRFPAKYQPKIDEDEEYYERKKRSGIPKKDGWLYA